MEYIEFHFILYSLEFCMFHSKILKEYMKFEQNIIFPDLSANQQKKFHRIYYP